MRLALLFVAACEQDLLAELPVDAPPPLDTASTCSTPSPPLARGTFTVFLATEGIAISKCNDDSRTSCSSLLTLDQATVPPFLDGISGRTSYIADIVVAAQRQLAPYSIDIVTARPSSGDYELFVLGGDVSLLEPGPASTSRSVTLFNCGVIRNTIDFIFDHGAEHSADYYAARVLSDVGALQGITATATPGDCECRFDVGCDTDTLCTFGVGLPVSKSVTCNRTTQDEPRMMQDALGCR